MACHVVILGCPLPIDSSQYSRCPCLPVHRDCGPDLIRLLLLRFTGAARLPLAPKFHRIRLPNGRELWGLGEHRCFLVYWTCNVCLCIDRYRLRCPYESVKPCKTADSETNTDLKSGEEVVNAGVVVPRAIITGIVLSGTFTFAFCIAILFCIGDISTVQNNQTAFPIIEIFQQATHSTRATNVMTAALISSLLLSTFGLMASASRLTWAFARDKGLPFSSYLSHVDKRYLIPVRTICLVALIMAILGLINIGSSTAFNAMVSLTVIGQYSSYLLSISLLLMRKYSHKHLPLGPFKLGHPWGVVIHVLSIMYSITVIVLSTLPPYQPVSAQNMNYASLVFGAVVLLSMVLWFISGKRVYGGPVRDVIENNDVKRALD